jgi:hypothetical protein
MKESRTVRNSSLQTTGQAACEGDADGYRQLARKEDLR